MNSGQDETPLERVVREQFGSKPIMQIAFLVEDLAEAVGAWSHVHDPDDWTVFTYGPDNVKELRYDGAPGDFRFRVALAGSDPQLELIEPLSGASSYDGWIAEHGYGIHHIAYRVESIEETLEAFAQAGVEASQVLIGQGLDGDGGSAYFDLEGIDVVIEALEVPKARRPSEEGVLR